MEIVRGMYMFICDVLCIHRHIGNHIEDIIYDKERDLSTKIICPFIINSFPPLYPAISSNFVPYLEPILRFDHIISTEMTCLVVG